MIITRFLRWCGWSIWTEAELMQELTRLDPPGKPPAPAQYIAINGRDILRKDK